jgi:transcriptional regulator with XRE-family HTH domain
MGRGMKHGSKPRSSGPKAGPPEYKIGAKVRKARLAANLKLQDLADRCRLSKALLSRIENDKTTPSISSLHDIAVALGINLSWFFDEERQARSQVVLRPGERHVIEYRTDGSTIENFVPFGGSHLLQGFLMVVEPGGKTQGTLTHYGEEVGYVLEGEFELTINGKAYRLKAGDSFNFRSEEPHSHRNPGKTRAVVIWINTPPTM